MNDNFERLDLIRRLSEIRSHYNCFNEKERKVYHTLSEAIEALEQQQWIPVTYRPAEGDELKHYMYMFTCDMPADEQDILVTVKGRHGTLWVERDVSYCEDGFTLDSGNDWRDVEAWMPLPKPYQEDSK